MLPRRIPKRGWILLIILAVLILKWEKLFRNNVCPMAVVTNPKINKYGHWEVMLTPGYNQNEAFNCRVSSIQVNYLGYPGTMGDECHDYIIADKFVLPKEEASNYTEKILYLPLFPQLFFHQLESIHMVPRLMLAQVKGLELLVA